MNVLKHLPVKSCYDGHPRGRKDMQFVTSDVFDDRVLTVSNAKWIWNRVSEADTYEIFRRKVTLDAVPETAECIIAADSKYTLYINGEMIVFEGSLKRGPTPYDTFADKIDIAPYLNTGENTVCVQVRYYGLDGFSHVDSGHGGFLFSCDSISLFSDECWRVRRNTGFYHRVEEPFMPTFRFAESNVCFDGRLDIGEFYLPDYDDSAWDNATVISADRYGRLIERVIPLFKDFGLKDVPYDVFPEKEAVPYARDLIIDMPYNCQFSPYIDLVAEDGGEVNIYTNRYADIGGYNIRVQYITREGRQQFESPGWINGHKLIVELPAGVKVNAIKYRETGYATEFEGSFTSNDALLNKLWEKARRTLYITMRDTFFDCPDRERAQWWGDAVNEAEMCYYSLSNDAHKLIKSGILSLAAWQHKDGAMQTVVPDISECFELPLQNLAGVSGFGQYVFYTGDVETARKIYSFVKSYLMLWETDTDGTVLHRNGSWDWPDWGENEDFPVLENAWYYFALSKFIYMCKEAGLDCAFAEERADKLKSAFNARFWNGEYYTSHGVKDDRANAMAVISGLAPAEYYPALKELLTTVMNSSPYMEKYVLEALCQMGYHTEALCRMRLRYREMTEAYHTTLWEHWEPVGGTTNHAWTGGPLVIMSKYIAGIRPTDTAYKSYVVALCAGDLESFSCEAPTPYGLIGVKYNRTEDAINVVIKSPEGAVGTVELPYAEGSEIMVNGKSASGDVCESVVRFPVCGGIDTFTVKIR